MGRNKELYKTEEYLKHGFKIVSCPVCASETLDSHYICRRCGWEYDGCVNDNDYSSANGSTVFEYRKNMKIKNRKENKK